MKNNVLILPGFLIVSLVLFLSCNSADQPIPKTSVASNKPIPKEELALIRREFKWANPYNAALDTLIVHLKKFDISTDDILWGQSICVDDITNTKDKFFHPEIMGPFNFGGLAGLPATGNTGVGAYAHHVPENGTALVFGGPHVGFSKEEGWGLILRHNQKHRSSCCGALVAALDKLKKGEIKVSAPDPEDYQEQEIEQLALKHRDKILSSPNPLLELTNLIALECRHQITRYAVKLKDNPEIRYVVLVNGVIINTDYQYTDYLCINSVTVLDVKRRAWMEWERPIQQ
ncbi:MAG TPA: hypothetical protein PLQ93_11410 [Bacteroidia bacterium]|nr:hypothetical protein [Bacteroidia bacterium]